MKPQKENTRARFALLLPLLLCAACTATLPPSTGAPTLTHRETPALPPALAKPPQPESYLQQALTDISAWRQRLTSSATR